MNKDIQIIEKPDWVSWDDIKQCLYTAHATNRANGINMAHYQWPAEQIKESLGKNGVMLVAIDDKIVVGTAAIAEKERNTWYINGRYAYMCFASVLPDYNGQGIYKALIKKREEIARALDYNVLYIDTHYKNEKIINISKKNGYKLVRFFRSSGKDHYSVSMVKWLNKCPFSEDFIQKKYRISKILTKIQYKPNGVERSKIISFLCNKIRKRFE